MKVLNYSFNEFLKKKKKLLLYMVLVLIFFTFFIKVIRPYSYQNYPELKSINFVLGLMPNFLGTILVFLMYNSLLEASKIKSAIYTMVLVFFIEIERYFYEGKAFDVYDIIASIIAIGIVLLLQPKSLKKLKAF